MQFRRFLISSALLAALLPAGLSQAANRFCEKEGDIGALADLVLRDRSSLPTLKGRSYGTLSAYLKIRYQNLDIAASKAILSDLAAARARRIEELQSAWNITEYGMDGAIKKPAGAVAIDLKALSYSPSVFRALALTEEPDNLAQQIAALPEKERLAAENNTVVAVLDQSDAFKQLLSESAMRAGLEVLASGLAATQEDSKVWGRFIAGIKDPVTVEKLTGKWRWAPAMIGNPALPRLEPSTEDQNVSRAKLHAALIGAAKMPELDFLLTYLNQTGETDQTLKAVSAIENETDSKERPWTMDRAWLAAYKALLAASSDPKTVDSGLRAFSIGGQRHYAGGTAREVLDWMISAEALTPYLSGKSIDLEVPARLSPEYASFWPLWVKSAQTIATNRDLASLAGDETTRAITAELLYAAGRPHDLALFLLAAPVDGMTVELAEDFAIRMDRTCGKFLVSKAEAIINPTVPILSFDR